MYISFVKLINEVKLNKLQVYSIRKKNIKKLNEIIIKTTTIK